MSLQTERKTTAALKPQVQSSPLLTFGALILILLVLRLCAILTSVELISYGDELDLGTIAREIIRGSWPLSFWNYQLEPYSGESLILGPLLVPLFRIFGQNLFAIKLLPLIFSIFNLCAIFYFTLRHFGFKAGLYAGLLYVFCPPGLVQLSLTAMSGRSEVFFFGLLSLIAFYEFLYEGRKPFHLALFGLISGFAIWSYYANAIIFVSCLILCAAADWKLFLRSLWILFPSFLIGFSPWILGNLQSHFAGWELAQSNFLAANGRDLLMATLRKPVGLALFHLPNALATVPIYFMPHKIFSYLYYAVFLGILLPFGFKELGRYKAAGFSSKTFFLLIYPLVFIAVFSISGFKIEKDIGFIGYRYLAPLLTMLLITAGIASASHPRGSLLLVILLSFGLTGQAVLCFKEPPGRALHYQGYSYYQLGARWELNLSGVFMSYEDFQNRTRQFSGEERRFLLWGINETAMACGDGQRLFGSKLETANNLTMQSMLKKESSAHAFTYEWLGSRPEFALSDPDFKTALQQIPLANRKYFCKGWLWNPEHSKTFLKCRDCYSRENECDFHQVGLGGGLSPDSLQAAEWPSLQAQIETFPAEKQKYLYRGIGDLLAAYGDILNFMAITPYISHMPEIHAKNQPDVSWGIGWAVRKNFREDQTRALDWIARLPESQQVSALEGAKAFEKWYELA